ncbi:MAG: hypothetical protein ABI408_08195 [Gemmatimonadaceae bacterium]
MTGTNGDPLNPPNAIWLSSDHWMALAKWAKQANQLNGFNRQFAYSMGRLVGKGHDLNEKQLKHAQQIVETACAAGWRMTV